MYMYDVSIFDRIMLCTCYAPHTADDSLFNFRNVNKQYRKTQHLLQQYTCYCACRLARCDGVTVQKKQQKGKQEELKKFLIFVQILEYPILLVRLVIMHQCFVKYVGSIYIIILFHIFSINCMIILPKYDILIFY